MSVLQLIHKLRKTHINKKKRSFVHISGNTIMNIDTNRLLFLGRHTSTVVAQKYIGNYCVSLVSSGNVYITVPPTAISNKKKLTFEELPLQNKIKYLTNGNTQMSIHSKRLYIYNGLHTSTVNVQKIVKEYCISITESGSVYVTVPPTMIK